MPDCYFHTGSPASDHCQQCGRPLCRRCGIRNEHGVFCSDNCVHSFISFSRKDEEIKRLLRKRRRPVAAFFGGLLQILLAAAVIYALYRGFLFIRSFL